MLTAGRAKQYIIFLREQIQQGAADENTVTLVKIAQEILQTKRKANLDELLFLHQASSRFWSNTLLDFKKVNTGESGLYCTAHELCNGLINWRA